MKLGIVIPWRPQPSRIYAFDAVVARYAEQFPEAKFYLADVGNGEGVFSVSGSRNLGCEMAIFDGCDVMLVSDADIFLEPYAIKKAIEESCRRNVVSIPFDELLILGSKWSTSVVEKEVDYRQLNGSVEVYRKQIGGATVITRETFLRLNGWDERFAGWGYEDLAFINAHEKIIGDYYRSHGTGALFYHEHRHMDLVDANRELYEDYASMSVEQLTEYLKGNRNGRILGS